MIRKAGSSIQEKLEQIFLPNSERTRKTSDLPYWYGLDEQGWKNMMGFVDKTAKQKVRQGDLSGARSFIKKQLNIPESELDNVMRDVTRGNKFRHLTYGVPHAQTGEKVMRDALILSGHHTKFAHGGDGQATDLLTSMLGNLDTYMDVQHRTGQVNNLSIDALMNMRDGVGINAFNDAMSTDTLGTIINRAKQDNKWTEGKLLHTLNPEFNSNARLSPEKQKDMLIGGRFADVQNMTNKVGHGFYDPHMPTDVQITDLNQLRSALLGMTKGEFTGRGVKGRLLVPTSERTQDLERKLKFSIPMKVVNEISERKDILDPDILRQMEKSSPR